MSDKVFSAWSFGPVGTVANIWKKSDSILKSCVSAIDANQARNQAKIEKKSQIHVVKHSLIDSSQEFIENHVFSAIVIR